MHDNVLDQIFKTIESYDSIVIFGHVNPDGDCVGSVMGLKAELNYLFPDKKVYGVGTHPSFLPRFVEPADVIDDSVIENSLAIMVDLSDLERVEDQRIRKAKEIVCFDHHMKQEKPYSFLCYREEEAPSATSILAKVYLEHYKVLTKKACTYFYMGLVTDTERFQLDSEPETLAMAGKLVSLGADYKGLYNDLYRQTSNDLKYKAFLYNNIRFYGKVTYAIVHKEDYLPLGFTSNQVSDKVSLLSLLDDHPIWVCFLEEEDGRIRVEYRANGEYNVQKTATEFGGGGHFSASGCTLKNLDLVDDILKSLDSLEKER